MVWHRMLFAGARRVLVSLLAPPALARAFAADLLLHRLAGCLANAYRGRPKSPGQVSRSSLRALQLPIELQAVRTAPFDHSPLGSLIARCRGPIDVVGSTIQLRSRAVGGREIPADVLPVGLPVRH